PPLAYVQVTPTNPSIPVQATAQLTATAVFTDNSTRNVTALSTWSSSNAATAMVANSGGTIGRATALAEGTTTITATYQGASGTTLLTVAGSVQSITVTPANPTTVLGLPVTFVATAILSNNASLVITGNASWVASDATVATVTAAGVATPVKAGSATITATYLGKSGTSTLTVSPATLTAIAITPSPVSLSKGASQQLTATGTYSDTLTRDLTSVVTWLSSASSVAAVSNANGSRGLLTALVSGTASVTAAFQGITSVGDTVTVP
ncbi:MAG TPA: Ig-like domain-containing protein, partial [Polyangia bacterium]